MTPILRSCYKAAFKAQDMKHIAKFASVKCFDMRAIEPLIYQTYYELVDNRIAEHEQKSTKFRHGGLFITPANSFWLEFDRFGIFVEYLSDENGRTNIGSYPFHNDYAPKIDLSAILKLNREDFKLYFPNTSKIDARIIAKFAIYGAASCMIINAPYGIRNEVKSIHKGQAKQMRREGYEFLPEHIITLDKSAKPPKGLGASRGGAPKAFHFVRSHKRDYKERNTDYLIRTVVKAHFRGDPRLGIHQASYRVKK